MPAIRHHIIEDAVLFGRTDIVLQHDKAYYTLHTDLDRHLLPEEAKYFLKFNRLKNWALFLKKAPRNPVRFEEAISLVGDTSINYVHWLTEYLPRLLLFEENNATPLPVIVDKALPPTLIESIRMLSRHGNKPFFLPEYQPCSVKKLHVIDVGCLVPFEYRAGAEIRKTDARFSDAAIAALRARCRKKIPGATDGPGKRKIFVLRNSAYRKILNQKELVELAVRHGYEIVEPEKHGFAEQVRIFSEAGAMVGQTGAGMGNLLFAPAGCRVILLAANLALGNYRYFHNLAILCGQDLSFVEGRAVNPGACHSDFTVDLECLSQVLQEIEPIKPDADGICRAANVQ
jgi:capsular polysaccharide biosynthesis protein